MKDANGNFLQNRLHHINETDDAATSILGASTSVQVVSTKFADQVHDQGVFDNSGPQ